MSDMDRIRILHVIDGLGVGGAETQLLLLLRHLPSDRFLHAVCHLGPREDLGDEFRALGIPVYNLSRRGRQVLVLAVIRLLAFIGEFHPDLIHTDGFYGNLAGRVVGRLSGIPVLTTVGITLVPAEGTAHLEPSPALSRRVLRTVNVLTGRWWTAHFMAITEAVKATVERAYGVSGDRVSVVNRGIDLSHMVPGSAEEIRVLRLSLVAPDTWPLLLHVGRLAHQKGQEYLIRAMPRIRAAHPRAAVLLVGEGALEGAYRSLAKRLGVSDAVLFLGRRGDVLRLLQAADVFIFPSLYEGTGIALLEAMAMGKPIIASDAPALREVAGDAAVFVPVGDADWLAEALIDLATQTDRWPALGARARRRVAEHFDITANAAAFGALCERVAKQAPSNRAGVPGPVGS